MAYQTRAQWWSLLIFEMRLATLSGEGPMDCQSHFAFLSRHRLARRASYATRAATRAVTVSLRTPASFHISSSRSPNGLPARTVGSRSLHREGATQGQKRGDADRNSSTSPSCAGVSSATIWNSSRRSGSDILKGVVGAAFITTPRCASQPTDSWSPSGRRFSLNASCAAPLQTPALPEGYRPRGSPLAA